MPSVELLITGFLGIMLLASFVSIKIRLPYTLALVFVGIGLVIISNSLVLGGGELQSIILQIRSLTQGLVSQQGVSAGNNLFVGLVVPPLIFEAMMHIRSSDLKVVIRPSFVLATVGVVIATLVGGVVLWKLIGLPFATSFLFAAIISPTDTATVLEIFRRAKVPSKLAALLDTEAAFNDATGIVVFTIVLASLASSKLPLLNTITNFAFVFGGGLVVGIGIAFLAELLSGVYSDPISQTILTIAAVYGSYALASGFGFSGLISVSVVGLYFGNLTVRTTMQPATKEAVRIFWAIAAFVGNSVAFLFIGFRTDLFKLSQFQSLELIGAAFLAVILARFATVYPILTIFDRLGKNRFQIPLKWRNVAMLGGARGALSIALAASISTSVLVSSSDVDTISLMVLGVAFISISLQAGLLFRYIKQRFPEEAAAREEALNVRLNKTISAIDTLQRLKEEGKISSEEFVNNLESDKEELTHILAEIGSTLDPVEVLKSRASDLYLTIKALPMSRAMHTLRLHHMDKSVETMISRSEASNQPIDQAHNNKEQ